MTKSNKSANNSKLFEYKELQATIAETLKKIDAYECERRRLDKHQGEDRFKAAYLREYLTRVEGKRAWNSVKDEVIIRAISKFYLRDELIALVNAIYDDVGMRGC